MRSATKAAEDSKLDWSEGELSTGNFTARFLVTRAERKRLKFHRFLLPPIEPRLCRMKRSRSMKTVLAITDRSDDPANFIRSLRPWSDPLFARSYRNTIGRPTETRNLDSFSSNTRVFHRRGWRIVAETKSDRETATSNRLLRLQSKAFKPHCYHYHCSVRYTHGKDCTRGIARNSKKRRKNAKRIGSSCTG